MKKKYILMFLFISFINSCSSTLHKKDNVLKIDLEEKEYLKYKEEFFDIDIDKNITIKYFEGSYTEGASSSFEPSIPSKNITEAEALNRNIYFKVIYNNGKKVKGIDIDNGVVYMIQYYDLKGRIIKRYNYYDNTFILIKYQGEKSLERIYCYDKDKYCRKEYLSREEDENEYQEESPTKGATKGAR